MRIFLGTLLQALIGLVIVALAWTVTAAIVNDAVRLPRLGAALERAFELARSDAYREHVTASLTVMIKGLLPAIAGGILLGVIAGLSTVTRWLLGPLFITLGTAPLIALMTLLLSWLGLGPTLTITAVALMTGFPVANAVMISLRARQGLVWARLPAAIAGGLRWGVVIGAAALVICEMLTAQAGVATFVMNAGQRFDVLSAAAGTILVLVPVIAIGAILQAIEEQLAG